MFTASTLPLPHASYLCAACFASVILVRDPLGLLPQGWLNPNASSRDGMGDNATGIAQCEDIQQPADAENSRQQTGMVNNQNGMQRASMVNAEGMVPS